MIRCTISPLLTLLLGVAAWAATPVRRLNRYEYNSTVRDLLSVEFRTGNDFPADNFSYGFDNNADTLTVTPALLAKYLDAAKKIARAAIEPVPPPAAPELERRPNASASPDLACQRNFIWEGDYDAHIAIAGRSDPFALSVSLDDGEPQRLSVSFDFEGRRYADTRFHLRAGIHRFHVLAIRDDDRAVDQARDYEAARARRSGSEPLSKTEIRTRLLSGELPDFAGAVTSPYPEYVEVRITRDEPI